MHGRLVEFLTEDRAHAPEAPRAPDVPSALYVTQQIVLVPLLIAALAWQLQHGALDLRLARAFADPATHAFVWRESALLEVLGHQVARCVPALAGGIALAGAIAGGAVDALRS